MNLLVVVALIAFLTWMGEGDPIDGGETLINEITRGKRVTHCPYNAQGVVPADPQALAAQAGVSIECYALARMLSSEEGRSSTRIKIAIGWCLVNEAAHQYKTVDRVLLRANNADHAGMFGTQKDIDQSSPNFGKSDRYASTALDPYQGDIDVARGILDGTFADETLGAQQFDRPAGEKNPAQVAAKRVGAGAELVMLEGVDDIRFWRS